MNPRVLEELEAIVSAYGSSRSSGTAGDAPPEREEGPERAAGVSRRGFLSLSAAAGGGLMLALSVGCENASKAAPGAAPRPAPTPAPGISFEAGVFVTIAPDSSATITVAKSEMGQGVRTTLALLVAEELDLDWSRVTVAQAPEHPDKYGRQGTGGSGSVRTTWKPLREAGAKARAMLVAAAAAHWKVKAAELVTENSQVLHSATGRRLGYGELTAAAAKQKVPATVTLKEPGSFRLLGKERPGVDVADIVRGKARYGMDLRPEGLLYAVIARPQIFGATVKSFDDAAAKKVPGVVKVVSIPPVGADVASHGGVAVIAKNSWAAMQGRDRLAIEWNPGPHAEESSAGTLEQMDRAVAKKGAVEVNKLGDPDGVLARAGEGVVSARYEVPFLAHATMEPMNCTAHVQGDRCHIWAPTQFPNWAAAAVAKTLQVPRANVQIEIPLLGGGFGRRINPDFVVEVAQVARHVHAPVQVLWSRQDDLQHDFYRPMAVHHIDACLDKEGYPLAWRHRMTTPAIGRTTNARVTDDQLAEQESNGASDMLYRVPNRSLEYTYQPSGVPRGWWRAVHTTHTTFAVESFLDELAERAGKDPYEYRLHLIDALAVSRPQPDKEFPWDPARLRGVLTLAAQKGGWGKPLPPGHGMGIACAIDHLSYAAEVIHASVIDGKLRIHKVVCAADCGPVMNPSSARAQLEGGIIQGLSAALKEKITISGGKVEQQNFGDYPILRLHESPVEIETYFAPTDAHPTGLGEPSVPPVASALAAAIYQATGRATGKRLRTLPLQI